MSAADGILAGRLPDPDMLMMMCQRWRSRAMRRPQETRLLRGCCREDGGENVGTEDDR